MLTQTIPSYLYVQYDDDDDLQAFVASFNAMAQAYVTWFNQTALAYYPGLSGPLLDWVAEGLYGLERTSLASPASTALGMLNTVQLNSTVLNGFTPSTFTNYSVSDDVFQRILTWDFYKGDGKRFSIPWLKRRIMRFLVGTNGLDPLPGSAGFTVGTENTSAIGVVIASSVVTVTINQTLLSSLTEVTPGILTLFQLAFEGNNVLDLPIQYTYVCVIVSALTVVLTPTAESSIGTALSQTTGVVTGMASGGSGVYTYAWTWASGGSGITINTPSGAATSFTGSGMVWGQTLAGVALLTATDTVSTLTGTAMCAVTIQCIPPAQILAENGNWLLTESGIPLTVET